MQKPTGAVPGCLFSFVLMFNVCNGACSLDWIEAAWEGLEGLSVIGRSET